MKERRIGDGLEGKGGDWVKVDDLVGGDCLGGGYGSGNGGVGVVLVV